MPPSFSSQKTTLSRLGPNSHNSERRAQHDTDPINISFIITHINPVLNGLKRPSNSLSKMASCHLGTTSTTSNLYAGVVSCAFLNTSTDLFMWFCDDGYGASRDPTWP